VKIFLQEAVPLTEHSHFWGDENGVHVFDAVEERQ
jgi:hypothetical protein